MNKIVIEKIPDQHRTLVKFIAHWSSVLCWNFLDKFISKPGFTTRFVRNREDSQLTQAEALEIMRMMRDLSEHAIAVANDLEIRILANHFGAEPKIHIASHRKSFLPNHPDVLDLVRYQHYIDQHRFNVISKSGKQPLYNDMLWERIKGARLQDSEEVLKELKEAVALKDFEALQQEKEILAGNDLWTGLKNWAMT